MPLIFLGHEVGERVITGNTLPEGDMLRLVFTVHGSAQGRASWDPMLVEAAVTQDLAAAGYTAVYGKACVDEATGENTFAPGEGSHCYLVKTKPDAFYAERINEILTRDGAEIRQ